MPQLRDRRLDRGVRPFKEVALTGVAGKILAEAIDGTMTRFDTFEKVPTPIFPGGRLLRWPTLVAAMSYYALRDRL